MLKFIRLLSLIAILSLCGCTAIENNAVKLGNTIDSLAGFSNHDC